MLNLVKEALLERWGIELGDTEWLIHAKPLIGRKLQYNGGKPTEVNMCNIFIGFLQIFWYESSHEKIADLQKNMCNKKSNVVKIKKFYEFSYQKPAGMNSK